MKKEESWQGGGKIACLFGREAIKVNKILSLQKYASNG